MLVVRLSFSALFVLGGLAHFADNRTHFLLYLVTFVVVTISLAVFRRSRLPLVKRYKNVRLKKVRNPLESVRLLLIKEFDCEAYSDTELVGIKRYGRGGIYKVSFCLRLDKDVVTASLNCNGAFPEYLFTVHAASMELKSALRSSGYIEGGA